MKATKPQYPKITARYSVEFREGARQWLDGASRRKLPGRAKLGKDGVPNKYRQVIMDLLGCKTWSDALKIRRQYRSAAKKAAKVEQKREAKSDAASQRRAA
jgi:hypothetical protein